MKLSFQHEKIIFEEFLGVPFSLGTNDCYSVVRKIMKKNVGLTLTNYARPNDFWLAAQELYVDNFRKEGFVPIDVSADQLQPLDVFLIALQDSRQKMPDHVSGHCAVYIGEGKIVHHLMGRLSEVMPYRGWIRERTTATIRHKDMPKFKPKVEELDIMAKMLPHKRAILEEALKDAKRSNPNAEKLSHEALFPHWR